MSRPDAVPPRVLGANNPWIDWQNCRSSRLPLGLSIGSTPEKTTRGPLDLLAHLDPPAMGPRDFVDECETQSRPILGRGELVFS